MCFVAKVVEDVGLQPYRHEIRLADARPYAATPIA